MGNKVTLAIKIIGDATKAVDALQKTEDKANSFRKGLKTASNISTAALGVITAGMVVTGKAAGDLQQSVGGVESVFKDSSSQMLQWSKDAAQSVGLSQNQYNEMATLIGSQMKNMGVSTDQLGGKTNDLIKLGADLSSMYGGTASDAVEALSSALKGEMDPIEQYGISLNDATLQQYAMANGQLEAYKNGDKNAKLQAILAAVYAQSADAQGNFAKEADTAQGQQQRMNAELENAKAALGESLLPFMTQAAQKLAEIASWVQQNTSWLIPLTIGIGATAAAIVLLNTGFGIYTAVSTAVAAGTISVAGAFGLLAGVTGIGLLIAAITFLVMNWDTVKNAAAVAADWISQKWQALTQWFAGVPGAILGFFSAIPSAISNFFSGAVNGARNAFSGLISFVRGIPSAIIGALGNVGSLLVNAGSSIINGLLSGLKSAWDNVTGFVGGIASWIKDHKGPLSYDARLLKPAGNAIMTGLYNGLDASYSNKVQPLITSMSDDIYKTMNGATANFFDISKLSNISGKFNRTAQATDAQSTQGSTYVFNFDNFIGDEETFIRKIKKAMAESDMRRGN